MLLPDGIVGHCEANRVLGKLRESIGRCILNSPPAEFSNRVFRTLSISDPCDIAVVFSPATFMTTREHFKQTAGSIHTHKKKTMFSAPFKIAHKVLALIEVRSKRWGTGGSLGMSLSWRINTIESPFGICKCLRRCSALNPQERYEI